jgi:hypothetical protein
MKHFAPLAVKRSEGCTAQRILGEENMKRKWWTAAILVFLEILVCGGILLTVWGSQTALGMVRLFYKADTHVEEVMEETFPVGRKAVLDVENRFGDVTVTGGEGSEVEIVAYLDLWGTDEEDARRQVDVNMTREGNRVNIRVEPLEYMHYALVSFRSPRVDLEIQVPSETSLSLTSSGGRLADPAAGDRLRLPSSVRTPVSVRERLPAMGNLTVSFITGMVELETSFGAIRAQDVEGSLTARSSSGDITLVGLREAGELGVETDFGDLMLQAIEADSLQARSSSGKISVEDGGFSDGIDLEADFGNIVVEDVRAASYRLVSSSGNVVLDKCSGPIELRARFGSVEVRDASDVQLTLSTDSGEIRFTGSLDNQGEHRVESEFGDVRLVLPSDAAFDLDAEAEFGTIDTQFPVEASRFEGKHIVGEVNGGGPLLRIDVGGGNITLDMMRSESE